MAQSTAATALSTRKRRRRDAGERDAISPAVAIPGRKRTPSMTGTSQRSSCARTFATCAPIPADASRICSPIARIAEEPAGAASEIADGPSQDHERDQHQPAAMGGEAAEQHDRRAVGEAAEDQGDVAVLREQALEIHAASVCATSDAAQPLRCSQNASSHMVRPTPRSSQRHAAGRANRGASSRAP